MWWPSEREAGEGEQGGRDSSHSSQAAMPLQSASPPTVCHEGPEGPERGTDKVPLCQKPCGYVR